jgi:hypothetical protein
MNDPSRQILKLTGKFLPLALTLSLGACLFEKRPPNNYDLTVYPVEVGEIKEQDAWARSLRINLVLLDKLNNRYVALILQPSVPMESEARGERPTQFYLTGWDSVGSIQPVHFSPNSFGPSGEAPFVHLIEWRESDLSYIHSGKAKLQFTSALH